MKKSVATLGALAILVSGSAWAHHNMSAAFDFNQRFTETGTLTQLDWRNPHIYVSVEVTREEGQVATWQFEGPSPGSFRARAIDKTDFANSIGKTGYIRISQRA